MTSDTPFIGLDDLVARIAAGSVLAVPPEYCGVAMAATRALVRAGVKRLHLLCVPTSGLQADILIGAGCIATVEAAAITFGELGPAPRFTRAVRDGSIALKDSTCPAIHAGLQASEKGIPFMPLPGHHRLRSDRPPARMADHRQPHGRWTGRRRRPDRRAARHRARHRPLPRPPWPTARATSGSAGGENWPPWPTPRPKPW